MPASLSQSYPFARAERIDGLTAAVDALALRAAPVAFPFVKAPVTMTHLSGLSGRAERPMACC